MTRQNDRLLDILGELIRRDSSEKEQDVADYIADYFKKLGCRPIRQKVAEGRENILVELTNGKPGGKSLLYVGHMDVVPSGKKEFWKYPPFELTEKDGKLYGRGSCDMKGSLAASMEAAARLLKEGISESANRILFLYNADEERQNQGAMRFLKESWKVDFILVGEPTGCTIGVGHRGVMAFTVTFTGKSAHAASMGEGVNAVYAGALFAERIRMENRKFEKKQTPVGTPSIQVTMIQGGTQVNMVPESCSLRVDRRLVPGENREEVKDQIEFLGKAAAEKAGCTVQTEATAFCPPSLCRKEEEGAALLASSMEKERWSVFEATCEAGLLAQKLKAPAVIFGPGDISMAHKTDEYVEKEQLIKAEKVYEAFFRNFLELQVKTPLQAAERRKDICMSKYQPLR